MAAPGEEVVLIGLCDGAADPKLRDASSCFTNKIGGSPDPFPGLPRPDPVCSLCGAPLVHVVQVYCPLGGSPYHRTLHLFACSRPACSGQPRAWRVLRSQALETKVDHTGSRAGGASPGHTLPTAAATDWCDAADDWSDGEQDGCVGPVPTPQVPEQTPSPPPAMSPGLDVSDGLQQLSLRSGPVSSSKEEEERRGDAPLLRGFYISVVEETELRGGEEEEEDGGMEHAHRLLREYEQREGRSAWEAEEVRKGSAASAQGEKYEKSQARHGDAAFRRFLKRVQRCPEQVLRYSWGGAPLFISDPPSDVARVVPPCGSCGGGRTFELQLMPALVSLLRPEGGEGGPASDWTPPEFGSVLVFSCRASCWMEVGGGGSPREEFAFLQEDPDQRLFL